MTTRGSDALHHSRPSQSTGWHRALGGHHTARCITAGTNVALHPFAGKFGENLVTVRKSDDVKRLEKEVAGLLGCPKVSLMLDGKVLQPRQTWSQLDVEDEDLIDVVE